jgi:sulfite exporter TauE/SafE
MLSFGLGASLPLLLIGSISAATVKRLRGRLARSAAIGQRVLGALFVLMALAALSGYDHVLESKLVALSPDWLTQLSSHF